MSDRHEWKLCERPRHRANTSVCASCLEDEALQQFAHEHGNTQECDYCGKTPGTPSVVPLDKVTEFMGEAIYQEWCDPVDTPRIDGEYYLKTFDADEMLYEIGFEVSNHELLADISRAFSDHDWCEADWQILRPSKRWGYGWDRFQYVVKHQRRYTFWYSRGDFEDVSHPDYLPPAEMLAEIEGLMSTMALVKPVPVGTKFWRLQLHAQGETLQPPERFTSPPIEYATQPNRMSPAGVPMFYAADDFDTALMELVDPADPSAKDKSVSGVTFHSVVPLNLLDLTTIPLPPSYFSKDGPRRCHMISFLRKFVKDLSQPIKRDGRQHIEYVPTQVFTEFVRHIMKGPGAVAIDGLRYPSSKNGKPCCVIFATQDECLPCGPLSFCSQKLEFVAGSMRTEADAVASCQAIGDLKAKLDAAFSGELFGGLPG